MAKKRQKKKQHKKELQERFRYSEHLTYNELVAKEAQAEKRKRQREKRYQKNLQLAKENNVDISITKSMTEKQVIDLINKEKRKQSRIKTQEKKIKLLVESGLSRKEAEEFKNASFKEIYDIINITYTSKKYIGVCWWDKTGENDLRGVMQEIQSMTLDEKINKIHDFYEEAEVNPDGSNDFRGVAFLVHGNSKDYVKSQLDNYKKRGYAWQVPYNYVNIGISNEFSVEGVVDMMYLAMARTSNVHRARFYDELKDFLYVNVPEIYKRIF